MKTLRNYIVTGSLKQGDTGPDAQVGDQVLLYLDTEAYPGLPEYITGTIQHPIVSVRCATSTSYDIEYDEADLLGVKDALVVDDVVDAVIYSAIDMLSDAIAAETAARIAGDEVLATGTTGLTAGNMLRVASGGGLEERTPAQVLADIAAAAAADLAALEFAGSDPNVTVTFTGVEDLVLSGPTALVPPTSPMIQVGVVSGQPSLRNVGDDGGSPGDDWTLELSGGFYVFTNTASAEFWTSDATTPDELADATWTGPVGSTGDPDFSAVTALSATFLGQWCKSTTAWWQWDGTDWIPRFTLTGKQITRNDADTAYYSLGVDGDGAPTTLSFP